VDYHEDFMAMVEVIEEYGGAESLTYFPYMIKKELKSKKIDMDKASASEMRDAKKIVHNKFLAMLMLSRANREKYGKLKRSMAKNYVTRTSKYPKSPEVVLRILSAYTLPPGWNRCLKQEGVVGDKGAMFVQSDGRDYSWKKNILCHNCGKKGHLKRECPNKKTNKGGKQIHANIKDNPDKGENIFVIIEGENIFVQARAKGVVNESFLLLDNQSTVNQIANLSLLKNIWKLSKPITVHCNARVTKMDLEGELGRMTVHHNPNSIANVLSLKSVVEMHSVTYNSWDRGDVFMVHTRSVLWNSSQMQEDCPMWMCLLMRLSDTCW
jgi:hypothetical protein